MSSDTDAAERARARVETEQSAADALAVVKVLDRIAADHLDDQWIEVSFPVAWIVFGKMSES